MVKKEWHAHNGILCSCTGKLNHDIWKKTNRTGNCHKNYTETTVCLLLYEESTFKHGGHKKKRGLFRKGGMVARGKGG